MFPPIALGTMNAWAMGGEAVMPAEHAYLCPGLCRSIGTMEPLTMQCTVGRETVLGPTSGHDSPGLGLRADRRMGRKPRR